MPAWDDYKSEAKTRGSLAHEVYVAQSMPAKSPEELKATLPDHLAYQAKLEAEGALMFAGPMSDESGTQMQGIGMMIYRATSFEHAKQLADADPMHATGARTYTLRKWMINEGSVSVNVALSGQSVTLG